MGTGHRNWNQRFEIYIIIIDLYKLIRVNPLAYTVQYTQRSYDSDE